MRQPRACPHRRTRSKAPPCQGTDACWLPAAMAPHKNLLSLTQGHPQRAGGAHGHPQDTGHHPPLLAPSMAMCLTTMKQKPGFDQRDDKTLDKALRLPPKALPALCRHQELDHRTPKATGECNYPCPADGEDDLAAQDCPRARPSGSQLRVFTSAAASPSNPAALPSPGAPGSPKPNG